MRPTILAAIAIVCFAAVPLSACQKGGDSVQSELDKQDKDDAAAVAKAKAANDVYLNEAKAKPGVKVTASGLQYKLTRPGNAALATPKPEDEVTVNYEGRLTDGTIFDSSYKRGEPTSFGVDGVIPGWVEGLQLMHPGDMMEFTIPSDLGYGPPGYHDIPPNAVLLFKVELISIKHPDGTVVSAK